MARNRAETRIKDLEASVRKKSMDAKDSVAVQDLKVKAALKGAEDKLYKEELYKKVSSEYGEGLAGFNKTSRIATKPLGWVYGGKRALLTLPATGYGLHKATDGVSTEFGDKVLGFLMSDDGLTASEHVSQEAKDFISETTNTVADKAADVVNETLGIDPNDPEAKTLGGMAADVGKSLLGGVWDTVSSASSGIWGMGGWRAALVTAIPLMLGMRMFPGKTMGVAAFALASYMAFKSIQQGALDNFKQAAGDQYAAIAGPSNGETLNRPLSLAQLAPKADQTNTQFNNQTQAPRVEVSQAPDLEDNGFEFEGPTQG